MTDLTMSVGEVDGTAAESAPARIEVSVGGMSCAACAGRIERALNKLDGAEAVVNFATERAVVTGLPASAQPTVIQTITRAGYTAVPLADEAAQDSEHEARLRMLRYRILVAALLTLPLSNLTIALALVPWLRFPGWEWVCVALATPVVAWAAWPFHRATIRNLRHRTLSMDTLVSLGVVTAYLWALVTLLLGGSEAPGYWLGWGPTPAGADTLYLEVASAVTTFLLIGRYFETRARGAATDVLRAIRALAPTTARVRRSDDRDVIVPLAALNAGDIVVIRPGETVPADATVTTGRSSVDTSTMTGEPVPQDVSAGDRLLAGTVNLSGVLEASVDRVGADTQIEQMAELAEQAQARKARVQRLVDRVVAVFVPVVLIVAALTMVGWLLAGAPATSAFSAALSVLVIACPCALGLATPTALMVGVGRAGQLGIVVKGPDAFEASGRITTVVLDKTGTLTTGEFQVDEVARFDGGDAAELLALGGAVERDSEHPVGRAIAAAADA
ncbi:MAG: cation-translocating P-type ATPase, partial [Micropruina sp.]|uniref:heavy metal translocating P-type ATPase n=1 Tax=Micropruina sp. TaxID=2737536 RepID=UPI0039E42DE1